MGRVESSLHQPHPVSVQLDGGSKELKGAGRDCMEKDTVRGWSQEGARMELIRSRDGVRSGQGRRT